MVEHPLQMNYREGVIGILPDSLVAIGLPHRVRTDVIVQFESLLCGGENTVKLSFRQSTLVIVLARLYQEIVERVISIERVQIIGDRFLRSRAELRVVRFGGLLFADCQVNDKSTVGFEHISNPEFKDIACAESRCYPDDERHLVAESELAGFGVGQIPFGEGINRLGVADRVGGGCFLYAARGDIGAAGWELDWAVFAYVNVDCGGVGEFSCCVCHVHRPFCGECPCFCLYLYYTTMRR